MVEATHAWLVPIVCHWTRSSMFFLDHIVEHVLSTAIAVLEVPVPLCPHPFV